MCDFPELILNGGSPRTVAFSGTTNITAIEVIDTGNDNTLIDHVTVGAGSAIIPQAPSNLRPQSGGGGASPVSAAASSAALAASAIFFSSRLVGGAISRR